MRTTISRKFRIDAGHRIFRHEGKCANLHGHSYEFTFIFTAEQLDNLGRVVDFGVIKEIIGTWLDENWDHSMIIWCDDPVWNIFQKGGICEGERYFPLAHNPTAENLAGWLFAMFSTHERIVLNGLTLIAVQCQETPNCQAIVTRG